MPQLSREGESVPAKLAGKFTTHTYSHNPKSGPVCEVYALLVVSQTWATKGLNKLV